MSRHPVRWGSLVFGLLYAATVAGWLVERRGDLDARTVGVGLAAALIVLGALGLAATVRLARSTSPSPHHDPDTMETSGTADVTTRGDDDVQEARPQH